MTPDKRVAAIGSWLESVSGAWPFLAAELNTRRADLVSRLIATNNEEVRGRIKALDEVLNLPESLSQERQGISAALAEQAAAD